MTILKSASVNWYKDHAPRMGAALAYYAMFSLAPLLLIMITIAKFAVETESAKSHLLFQIHQFLGPGGVEIANSILENQTSSTGLVATIVGVIILFIGVEGVFRHLRGTLNSIWKVEPKKKKNKLAGFLLKNLFIFLVVVGAGGLLIGSFLLTAVFSAINSYLPAFPALFWEVINGLVTLAVVTILFTLALKFLPDVKLKVRNILPGAVIAAAFFLLGKLVFGFYIGLSGVGSAYGAAGSIVAFLAWLYYSAQIFLFGAEITKSYSKLKG